MANQCIHKQKRARQRELFVWVGADFGGGGNAEKFLASLQQRRWFPTETSISLFWPLDPLTPAQSFHQTGRINLGAGAILSGGERSHTVITPVLVISILEARSLLRQGGEY